MLACVLDWPNNTQYLETSLLLLSTRRTLYIVAVYLVRLSSKKGTGLLWTNSRHQEDDSQSRHRSSKNWGSAWKDQCARSLWLVVTESQTVLCTSRLLVESTDRTHKLRQTFPGLVACSALIWSWSSNVGVISSADEISHGRRLLNLLQWEV